MSEHSSRTHDEHVPLVRTDDSFYDSDESCISLEPLESGASADAEYGYEVYGAPVPVPDYSAKWKKNRSSIWKSWWRVVKQADAVQRSESNDAHLVGPELLAGRFGTNLETGLNESQVAKLRSRYGRNETTTTKPTPGWIIFLTHLVSGFSLLLDIGAALCLLSFLLGLSTAGSSIDFSNLYVAVILALVVFITAVFTRYQESKSETIMAGFAKLAPKMAQVVRSGKLLRIPVTDIVPGDLLMVSKGDKVPADMRVISCEGFKVDNSSLTGETEPQVRDSEISVMSEREARCVAFYSTSATEGFAKGIAYATGDSTMIGRIQGLVQNQEKKQTPLRREIVYFTRVISLIALGMGGVFFIISLVFYSPILSLVYAIGIIVANVPEGLLITVTVALTLTAKRMASKNVLVKNLESVETLGSTSTICSDKTGTLTQNIMTVSHLWYDDRIFCAKTSTQEADFKSNAETFIKLQRCATLCNNAAFVRRDDSHKLPQDRETTGDASESALIKFVQPLRDIFAYRAECPSQKGGSIPFNSTNKYQVSVHKVPGHDEWLMVMKGAPERIVARCSRARIKNSDTEVNAEWMEKYENSYSTMGEMGERVLGFAEAWLPTDVFPASYKWSAVADANTVLAPYMASGLTFLGLISLIDPPRPAVPLAVRICQDAGIKVIMVTGDHPNTAKAIAKKVGIIRDRTLDEIAKAEGRKESEIDHRVAKAIVIHGGRLEEMTEDELDIALKHEQIVFARTSPEQKLRIVMGCQRRGDIVAVTGDGVNDAPALKRADIGVAMGITGSEVSKEAAAMILMDDNFASIVRGVKEGRIIYDNLKKSIAYTLCHILPEIVPFLLFIILQIPLPLGTLLILCIDLGADMVPSIALAYEEAESDIMLRRPRNPKTDKLITLKLISFSYLLIGLLETLGCMFTYYVVMNDYGFSPSYLLQKAGIWETSEVVQIGDLPPFDETYRVRVLRHAQTAYFVAIVLTQAVNITMCKTRRLSVFQQGLTNRAVNIGLCSMMLIAVCVVYAPGLQIVLGTEPLRLIHWFPCLPFLFLLFLYEESRKFMIRRTGLLSIPARWLESNSMY